MAEIDIDRIDANPFQPRQHLEPAKLQELARSLAQQGVMQPLLVRRVGSRYQLIAGERRWRAARMAGLTEVPVLVRDVEDHQLLEWALVENIQREDLNPIEEAGAYHRMQAELGLSQEQIADRVGKDRSTVANLLRLLRLPAQVREAIAQRKLSPGHARPLLALEGPDAQIALAQEISEKGLTAREAERRVKEALSPREPKGAAPAVSPPSDPNTRAAEDRLRTALGTKVRIQRKGTSGTVEISFYSEEELQRIYELLLRGTRPSVHRVS